MYSDDDDNQIANQQIGIGDGTSTIFTLIRALGGFIEPVGAPNVISAVTVDGAAASYAIDSDGAGITLPTPPSSGAIIAASFSYYWRCRFSDDTTDFTKFLFGLSSVSNLKFESVK